MEVDPELLYTVEGSIVVDHKQWINADSGFGQYNAKMFTMIVHADGENVIGDEGIRRCFSVVDMLRETPGYADVCKNTTFIDMDGEDTCELLSVTRFWNHKLNKYRDQVSSDDDAISAISTGLFPDGAAVDLPAIFGNFQTVNGTVTVAESYSIIIPFPVTKDAKTLEGRALENLLRIQEDWDQEDDNIFRLEVQAGRSLQDESTRAIMKDMPLIPLVFVVMSCFTCLSFWQFHKVKSKSLVGLGAVVSVLLAVLSGFGFLFLWGKLVDRFGRALARAADFTHTDQYLCAQEYRSPC